MSGDVFLVGEDGFEVGGRPVRLPSRALHCFRVHEAQWAHRLAMLRAMGLDCVETYVPRSSHARGLRDAAPPPPGAVDVHMGFWCGWFDHWGAEHAVPSSFEGVGVVEEVEGEARVVLG